MGRLAAKAMKALAAKIARIAYRMMKYGEAYIDRGNQFYEEKCRSQQVRILNKKASELGLQVVGIARLPSLGFWREPVWSSAARQRS